MSAIWGIIDFSQKDINTDCISSFETQYNSYAINRIDSNLRGNAYFACGHQFLTPTATTETLPFYDKGNDILFTCDAMLDNREELIGLLPGTNNTTPDGTLVYQAYLKWGANVCDHLLGAFTFAVYHQNTNQCHLFTDHMGNRSLFYCFKDNILFFSTLIVPLQSVSNSEASEKWLTSCLSNTSAVIAIFESLTPFEDIYQCLPSTHCSFGFNSQNAINYWSPLNIKPNLKLPSDNDYKNLFIETIQQSIKSQLRTVGNVGATLSGGLDSTTVASFVAEALATEDKTLHSYTSVPLAAFKESSANSTDSYSIVDESSKVLDFCKIYPNIQPAFLSCPDKDGFSALPQLVPLLGYPMKSGHNLTWLNEIYSTAHKDGCTLMFKGQFGNSTFSYGPALTVFYQLLCSGKFKTLYECVCSFQKKYHVPKKKIAGFMVKEYRNHLKSSPFDFDNSLAPASKINKHGIPAALKRMERSSGIGTMDSRSQRMNFMYDRNALSQLGMFDTAMGLIHGLIIRDPSKDKRVVELCARMPVKYYIAGGLERGLIRTFMRGRIPDSILLDIHHRGLQSADNHFRIEKNWHLYKDEMTYILKSGLLDNYADAEKISKLTKAADGTEPLLPEATRSLNILYSLAQFINSFERNTK